MKMRKVTAMLTAAMLTAGCLAGCGDQQSGTQESAGNGGGGVRRVRGSFRQHAGRECRR